MKLLRCFASVCAPVACALLVGCSKSDNKPPTGVAGVSPQGRMEMQFKWNVGKQYALRMELSQTSDTDIPNQKQPIKQAVNMTQDYTISVLKELPDDGKELQLEFTGVTMDSKLGDRVVLSFDSTQDAARDAGNPVAPMLRRMVGGQLKYLMDSDGRVDKVEGVRELAERVMQGSPPQIKAAFSTLYSEGYFKQLCDMARMAPGRGVKPGATWEVNFQEDEMGSLGKLLVTSKMKFADWEQRGTRKCARIESTGDITSKPAEAAGGPASAMAIEIEKGKVTATGWFDPELGMVVESIADQELSMKITTQGITTATRVKQKINFKLLDVTDAAK